MTSSRAAIPMLAVALCAAVAAQERVPASPAAFAEVMVANGNAFDLVERAVTSPSYLLNSVRSEALDRVEHLRRNAAAVKAFFEARKKKDGVVMADAAIEALAELRHELARAEPDPAAAEEALTQVSAACGACHDAMREGSVTAGFRFKPGVLEP